MFREMRRKNQLMDRQESQKILLDGTSGVLALSGDEGYPYAVPLSYVYDKDNDRIYFHCARTGHKIDAVRRCDKASFCVIGQDEVCPERYTTLYKSVIAFGRIRLLEGDSVIRSAIEALAVKYNPEGSREDRDKEIDTQWPAMSLLELTVEHMTGKQCIEFLKKGKEGMTE